MSFYGFSVYETALNVFVFNFGFFEEKLGWNPYTLPPPTLLDLPTVAGRIVLIEDTRKTSMNLSKG